MRRQFCRHSKVKNKRCTHGFQRRHSTNRHFQTDCLRRSNLRILGVSVAAEAIESKTTKLLICIYIHICIYIYNVYIYRKMCIHIYVPSNTHTALARISLSFRYQFWLTLDTNWFQWTLIHSSVAFTVFRKSCVRPSTASFVNNWFLLVVCPMWHGRGAW